jgi:alpha-L-fucosidase 2
MQKITRRKFLGTAAILPFASSIIRGVSVPAEESLLLWYDKPASEWTEALPIGNGRLGAMIFGGLPTEQLQLNEDTLYAGSPYDPNNPEALKALPEARRLIFAQIQGSPRSGGREDDGPPDQADAIRAAWRSETLIPRSRQHY